MTSDYAIISSDISALVQLLVDLRIAFRYDPKGRFSILLPHAKKETVNKLRGFEYIDRVVEVFITSHEGVLTMPEMQIRRDADSRRFAEEGRIESERLNYPG